MSKSSSTEQQERAGELIGGGRYRLGALIGRGGMGAVYEGEHLELQRPVAIKTLLPELVADERTSTRLIREARAAAAIGHPGIVDVIDLVREDEITYVVMERLDGEELRERLNRVGTMTVAEVLRLGIEVGEAVASAHSFGIVHRDLKPRYVFVTRHPRLGEAFKVLDFGIAKLAVEPADLAQSHSGQIAGTPLYMAPERLAGEQEADPRLDVYGIGALLYEALAGRPPFQAETYPELVLRIATESPPPLRGIRDDVPAGLDGIVMAALAKRPEERPQSALVLVEALRALDPSLVDSGVVPSPPPTELADTRTSVRDARDPTIGSGEGMRRAPAAWLGLVLVAAALGWLAMRSSDSAATGSDAETSPPRPQAIAQPPAGAADATPTIAAVPTRSQEQVARPVPTPAPQVAAQRRVEQPRAKAERSAPKRRSSTSAARPPRRRGDGSRTVAPPPDPQAPPPISEEF